MSAAFSSPVNYPNMFKCEILCKVEVVLQVKTISVSRCESLEIRLFYRTSSRRKRRHSWSVFHRNSPKYSSDQRGKLNWNWLICCSKLCRERNTGLRAFTALSDKQPNKLTQLQKESIEFNYSDFPCHSNVNRDKLALINRRWMCYRGKRLTITTNSFATTDSARCGGQEIPPTPGTNQIVGFVEFRPLTSSEKHNFWIFSGITTQFTYSLFQYRWKWNITWGTVSWNYKNALWSEPLCTKVTVG